MIGYTTGVFDLFHIGHLNLLRAARAHCDHLIVGVTTDELAFELKGRETVIPFSERADIVSNIRCVDEVVPESVDDKMAAWQEHRFNIIIKGDDWKGSPKWKSLEEQFSVFGVEVVFLPYTQSTSSTLIRRLLESGILAPT